MDDPNQPYFTVAGVPFNRQSTDSYSTSSQAHGTQSSPQPMFYPGPQDPGIHYSYSQYHLVQGRPSYPSSASYPTASDHPSIRHGHPGSDGNASSSSGASRSNSGANPMPHHDQAPNSPSECLPTGDLHITVHKARDIEGKEYFKKFGKADPFVEITLDDQTQRTTTHNNAGSNPTWNQILPFLVKTKDTKYNKLSIKIFNKNNKFFRKDGLLGYLKLSNLGQCIIENRTKLSVANWYPVFRDGEEKGNILLSFRFFPQTHEQMLNNLGNVVTVGSVEDPKAEYTLRSVGGGIQILLQGAAVGLAVAAL